MTVPPIETLTLLHNNICKALGDPRRIQILYALSERPCHVTGLAEQLDVPQPTVSRHLRILHQRSLVMAEREGTTIIYCLADPRIIDILDAMRQLLKKNLERQSRILA
ncbi:MAG: winged helix-turn-helix transcriptional regulator [Ardenticatenaceae bacterium]|nr:winged helix-turn-helix transcriptional regulator [Ardenticatenaceae bacterium]MCB9442761.1 winged helix-turn-helix transcriptional regulator [Ardenticatenaceae bacterium]MCB9446676.1 winged helix-turn-helix transcriptional regulator [Ardenticatenaceae bacterium]